VTFALPMRAQTCDDCVLVLAADCNGVLWRWIGFRHHATPAEDGKWPSMIHQYFSTFLLPQNPTKGWRLLTEPHAMIRKSSGVGEVKF